MIYQINYHEVMAGVLALGVKRIGAKLIEGFTMYRDALREFSFNLDTVNRTLDRMHVESVNHPAPSATDYYAP